MAVRSRIHKHSFHLAWAVFVLTVTGWFVLRGLYGMGAACDLLIVPALAAQAWLLFLTVDKQQ